MYLKDEFPNILPAFSPLKKDELFSSWISRLAHDHYLKVHVFCKLVLKNANVWNRDIDNSITCSKLENLAEATRVSLFTVKQSLLSSFEGILISKHNPHGNSKWIIPAGIYHRKRKRNSLMFCPECLRKDADSPYYRRKWRLSLTVVCARCNSIIYDQCPQCNSPIVFFRNELGKRNQDPIIPLNRCYNCGYDLTLAKRKCISRRFYIMQKHFEALMNNGKSAQHKALEYFDVLHQMIKIINGRNEVSCRIRRSLSKKCKIHFHSDLYDIPFEMLSIKNRIPILYCAYWLLEDWPQRFIKFFFEQRIWSSVLLKDFDNPPFWYNHVVNENLFVSNSNRKNENFRKIYRY